MNEIKMIIWDLDDTLWKGTLAEGDAVEIKPKVVEKIQYALDRGIQNSICSKNDFNTAMKKLKEFKIDDLFIFPKISFEDKGIRIKKTIEQAQLREQNVLFVDDNPFILREVKHHNPQIMVLSIDEFMELDISKFGKDDSKRERLKQYKILEIKEQSKNSFFENNQDEYSFLRNCDIVIDLIPINIYDKDNERILELINRSNQLNFTNSRIKFSYVFDVVEMTRGDNYKVKVKDKYGNYGIVGYVYIFKNTLIHFVFSCRILGMRVEAKLYQYFKKTIPDLKISFDLAKIQDKDTSLDFIKINLLSIENNQPQQQKLDKRILVRGTCLCNAVSSLLADRYIIDEEIFMSSQYSNIDFLRRRILNGDKEIYCINSINAINNEVKYDSIINFLDSDYFSGNYKYKNKIMPRYCHYIFWENFQKNPVANKEIINYLNNITAYSLMREAKYSFEKNNTHSSSDKIFLKLLSLSNHKLSMFLCRQAMKYFFKNYTGYISTKKFEDNMNWYIGLFPKNVKMIFINLPEEIKLPIFSEEQNTKILERARALNNIMRKISKTHGNVYIVEMNNIITSKDIVDSYSHLKRSGYVKVSLELSKILTSQ